MHTLIILLFIFFGNDIKKLSEGSLTDEERKEILDKFEKLQKNKTADI